MSLSNSRKVLVGSTEGFDVLLPEAWSGAPTLTFRRGGVEFPAAPFTAKRAADAITAITNTVLTGVFAGAIEGLAGPVWGEAVLRTANDGLYHVQIDRLTASAAYLSEPLPEAVIITVDAPASLVWKWFTAAVPGAVTASETGTAAVDWWVTYTADRGAAVGTLANQRLQGTLAVVSQLFATGVGDEALTYWFGHLVPRPPTDAKSWGGAIEAARMQLVARIRSKLNRSATGRREDDLNGADFAQAHATWALALILQSARRPEDLELARDLQATAHQLVDQTLDAVTWQDTDGDGIGAHGQPASKGSLLVGGVFTDLTAQPNNPFDYRRGRPRGR